MGQLYGKYIYCKGKVSGKEKVYYLLNILFGSGLYWLFILVIPPLKNSTNLQPIV